MSRRGIAILALVVASAVVAGASARDAADGGSGTYTVADRMYYFVLFNSGTASWQYFDVVGPPGTTFVGGGTMSESTPRCVVGPPDEIECGPLGATLAAPLVHLGFAATTAAPITCGSPFALYVSATGDRPFTRVGDATFAGSCDPTPPYALRPPTISGTPLVGRTLTAVAPIWSVTPTRVAYHWELCSKSSCTAIRRATTLRLKLTSADRAHSVRIVAIAMLNGVATTSRSGKLAVRAR